MMKRKITYLILTVLVIIFCLCQLTGCKDTVADAGGYQIYYTNSSKGMLLTANYNLRSTDPLELVKEMWEKMRDPGASQEQASLVPEKLEISKWDLTDGQLTVTFSSEYLTMDGISEVLFRAGFVETVTQLSEVKKVVFHIGNEVLKNSSGDPVGAMTRSTFINNPVGINSYQFVSLNLYFVDNTGESIVKEMRNLHYSTNTTLPKVVMEQLMKGPLNKDLRGVFSENVKVLDIKVDGSTCIVDFNQEFLKDGEKLTMEPEAVIYSIVNSLCDVINVDKVQFKIEGDSDVKYAGSLSFNGPFHRNSSLIIKQDEMIHSETETQSLELGEPQIGL